MKKRMSKALAILEQSKSRATFGSWHYHWCESKIEELKRVSKEK